MSRFEFRLHDVAEGIDEAEIISVEVAVGDHVEEHSPMLEVMTDKASVEIGSPKKGEVLEVRVKVGEVVRVGAVLVVLEVQGDEDARGEEREVLASAVGDIRSELPSSRYFENESSVKSASSGVLATPALRGRARATGVDLGAIRGSGEGGRILDSDLSGRTELGVQSEDGDEREKVVGLRRAIANRMQRATTRAAHFTFVEECDVSALLALRARLEPEAAKVGVALSFLPLIARAVAHTLLEHRGLGALYDEGTNELVRRSRVHLGIATATENGLVVPVVRDASSRSLLGLAREIGRLSTSAREGSLRADELKGSTFTITSLGRKSGLLATPVLNLPEVAILGVHRIKQRPVVRDGAIVVGDVMLLSLSCDHRFVDGDRAADFVYDLIAKLEAPSPLAEPFDDEAVSSA